MHKVVRKDIMIKVNCKLLDIRYQLYKGNGMGNMGISRCRFKAGGLGLIGAGNAPAEVIRNEIRRLRPIPISPLASILLLSPFAEEVMEVAVKR